MKTIDERAREYEILHIGHGKDFCVEDFILGAHSEYEELTRWHDAKEPPHDQYEVLAKIDGGYFKVVVFEPSKNLWRVSGTQEWINIISWREIHE